jgi:hypothetical protein
VVLVTALDARDKVLRDERCVVPRALQVDFLKGKVTTCVANQGVVLNKCRQGDLLICLTVRELKQVVLSASVQNARAILNISVQKKRGKRSSRMNRSDVHTPTPAT